MLLLTHVRALVRRMPASLACLVYGLNDQTTKEGCSFDLISLTCGADMYVAYRISCWRFSCLSYVYYFFKKHMTSLVRGDYDVSSSRLSLCVPILIGTNTLVIVVMRGCQSC